MSKKQELELNPRGIPRAPFVERVEDYEPVETTLVKFQELVSKYKFMEANLVQRKKGLEVKTPEIKKTLDAIQFLRDHQNQEKSLETSFEVNDTLYARALVKPVENVFLWLGANVMLEYSLEEAESLLSTKLAAGSRNLQNVEEDLEFLREQITTMEVNTARIHNWDVTKRRMERLKV